jgi:DNA-binding CsgD family transcriptional regulator
LTQDGDGDGARGRAAAATVGWSPTARQRDVLRGVVNGLTAKEVARRLGISTRTVEGHLHALRRLTGAGSMGELCALSVAHGWVTPLRRPEGTTGSCPERGQSCSETVAQEGRGGRPTVMTPQRITAARELLRTHTIKDTARSLRVSRSTLYAHMDVIVAGR